ncbi:DNA cytosine methyltransferase [Alteromonas antoniana]|uniref:DNA cytosine methyltransferase n=1 Tax=Alteromonas antoniana TaxID=2803813 RepID=UPI001C452AC3|nr:DNA cytosine methyltransferase [Alteromonas antoniana]
MNVSETLKLSETGKGKRVWMNNNALTRSGLVPGMRYDVIYFDNYVDIIVNPHGKRVVVDNGKSLIDLETQQLGNTFPDVSEVSVAYLTNGVRIRASHNEEKIRSREKVIANPKKTWRIGELFAGFGHLGAQISKGLQAAGVMAALAFANEYDRVTADIHATNQHAWEHCTADALLVNEDLLTMNMEQVPDLDMLIMGYPCVGFSAMQSNPDKRDTRHPQAGALFVRVLEVINRSNPSVIVLENSPFMQDSETMHIIDAVLHATGYSSESTTLKGTDHGDFEPRKRLAKVWYSSGFTPINLHLMQPTLSATRTVSDVVEYMPEDSPKWRDYAYLRKHASKKTQGHGFFVAEAGDTTLKTFGANYAKAQPDSSFLPHPTEPNLYRMFEPSEHANIRRVDGATKEAIVSVANGKHCLVNARGSSKVAHQILGNSVAPRPWLALGKHLGDWVSSQHNQESTSTFDDDDFLKLIA